MTHALALVLLIAAADPKSPDLGFDYQTLVVDHMKAVSEGKADLAIELIESRATSSPFLPGNAKEAMSKRIALIYGAGGKHAGSEVVGYKRLSSRLVKVYGVGHFDRYTALYVFTFLKQADGEWRLHVYAISDSLDELDKGTGVTPFPRAAD